jgi:hypothetical protein
MDTTDLEQDACDLVEFFVALAQQDAALVADFLRSAGIEPGAPLPQNALLKLGIYCRLRLWEEIGLTTGGAVELPAAHTVFADILAELTGEPPQFETVVLGRQVHMFALQRLTWPQSGAPTFMLDDRADASDLLDFVAELLWNYRHLAEAGSSSAPASPMANLEESAETIAAASTVFSPSAD